MKTVVFIEARVKDKIKLPVVVIDKLPKEIALFTTVQFIDSIIGIKEQLKKGGITVKLFKSRHAKYAGQILGCGIEKYNAKAFLYIGDGKFHPESLLINNKKPVFCYNPFTKEFYELKDAENIEKRIKGALIKFYSSTNIGVLVSTKPGQNNFNLVNKLKNRFKDKKFYVLVADNIEFSQLENFPFIECFVNTACPRIAIDEADKFPKAVVNAEELYS